MSFWYQRYWEPDKVRWMEGLFRQRLQRLFEPQDRGYACDESVDRALFQRLPNARPSHEGNLDGYVYNALSMAAHDVMRHLYGRPRPPAEVRRAGPEAIRVFELFAVEGRCVRDIAEELDVPEKSVTRWTHWLLENGKCHWRPTFVETADELGVEGIWSLMRPAAEPDDPVADEIDAPIWAARLARLRQAKATLAPSDRRLLALLYADGYDPATAAAMLGLSEEEMEARHAALMEELERVCGGPP